MKRLIVLSGLAISTSLAQQPFQSLEGAIGYIVVERGGRVENYLVLESKDGSVRLVKVERNPGQFMRKTEEPRQGGGR